MMHDIVAVLALSVPLFLVWKETYLPAFASLFLILSYIAE